VMGVGSKIRVAMFSNSPSRGGVEQHILTLLHSLDRSRFELFFVCDPALLEILKNETPADVKVFAVELRAFSDFRGAFQFRAWLNLNKIDLVHCHMSWATLFGGTTAKLAGVPKVIETTHIREVWRKGWKSSYAFDRLISTAVDRYIAVSDANGEYLVNEKHLPQAKVTVIKNGADLRQFVPRQSTNALRRQFGFTDDDLVILVPARLEEQKGHKYLIAAVAEARKSFADFHVVFLGSGALKAELLHQVESAGLSNTIHFVEFQSNMQEWFAMCSFAALPSLYEGLPLVAIEALACERTLVASAVDGTPEIVVHEKTGLLVPPAEPHSLANAILRLMSDEPLRNQLARNGRRYVVESFSIERQVAETESLYCELAGVPVEARQKSYSECR
jgi:glycosyltransferase involved in cell wall biosynthesis